MAKSRLSVTVTKVRIMLIEEYIFNCKVDKSSKFYGMPLAEIAVNLLIEKNVNDINFFFNLCYFLNKSDGKYWKFFFSDGSLLVLSDWLNEVKYFVFSDDISFAEWLCNRSN